MNGEPRDYIKEAESMLGTPKPLKELLEEARVPTMEKLFGFLNIDNTMIRKATVYALGQIGDPCAIEQLELRLKIEPASGIIDAIKASIAALKNRPVDKFSELERRQYISDVYKGNISEVVTEIRTVR